MVAAQRVTEISPRSASVSTQRLHSLVRTPLLGKSWSTQASYDSALATRRQSEAELARAEAAIEAAQAQERSAAATVKVNDAMLE